ncbi:MAG TPA: glycosyl transferase family 1 [Acidovorax sp.]|nr:glycosyl transferase family 1 [Acidovorax sp.]
MRIVIDMQGAQSSGNWNRGIGRYTMSLALAMVRNRGVHEVVLALNGAFTASVERIRAKFESFLPRDNIRVWHGVPPMAYIDSQNNRRRNSAEIVREAFLDSLDPDVVIVSSLFEGLGDDAVTSLKRFPSQHLTAVILYDLIPFIHRQPYLENPVVERWYLEKIEHLRQADLWLGISESSCQEGVDYLGLPAGRSVNISTDADSHFKVAAITAEAERSLRQRYGLDRKFVMYTGGIDHRKNIEGLIRAYAKLSAPLRATHQLAVVCAVQEDSRKRLLLLASEHGLNAGELVLTGYVSEEELISLYNLCVAFVFPSWHEGFGLPALEAMRCGAPVIAADGSSLPEVVGYADALFDPHSDEAIARAIERVLTDELFREKLRANGSQQAKKFSWDETASRAIRALERVVAQPGADLLPQGAQHLLPKLAYVSPLPPERSGISDYSAELLPALAQHYEIEVIVAQAGVTDDWITANCPVRTVDWFIANSARYDRVIYHFGNSAFHQHMFGLLDRIPGVVVLHDFFLSGVIHHMDGTGYLPGYFVEQLYRSHGYVGLSEFAQTKDAANIIWKYPCSRIIIESGVGVIVHSRSSNRLTQLWYGDGWINWSALPLLRAPAADNENAVVRTALGFAETDFVVCSFGIIGPTKLNHRLLNAWLASDLAKSENCHLIFVGENNSEKYGSDLLSQIGKNSSKSSIHITGWVDKESFNNYLVAANIGVQLRTLSRGETSAAVLDCMNHGLATIVNANGSMADLADDAVWKLHDEFDDQALIHALETLWRDQRKRSQIGENARSIIRNNHDPRRCAELYKISIEDFYKNNRKIVNLPKVIEAVSSEPVSEDELMLLAESMDNNFPSQRLGRTIWVDVSELVQTDARTGIQRVVRSVLRKWLLCPPAGWRVEPVYATATEPYRYAREFTSAFLGLPNSWLRDEPVDCGMHDIFFVLDLCPQVQTVKADFYQHLRQQGVMVKFLVYDLLCIQQPHHFLPGAAVGFTSWLEVVGECDGAICISRTIADELRNWMNTKQWKRLCSFQIAANPLGADVHNSAPTMGVPADAKHILAALKQRPTFLMIGTLEPRKGHVQVLDAFEHLWRRHTDANLVIVGKQGWMVDQLVERLCNHLERGNRLFWLEGISDEYLEKIYAASTCLIAASYGEGFGLPLIEAAQHKLPIIARDIPVFHEVAGEHAYYFNAEQPGELAEALRAWLALYREAKHPRSDAMPWLTWEQSATELAEILLASDPGPGRCHGTTPDGGIAVEPLVATTSRAFNGCSA